MAFTATVGTRPHRTVRPDQVVGENRMLAVTADGAIPLGEDRTFHITKGSAAALTVAAPGAANIGRRLIFITGSDFAHALTFTGSTLRDGATGNKITWTAAAFTGCALTVRALSATTWGIESRNAGVIA